MVGQAMNFQQCTACNCTFKPDDEGLELENSIIPTQYTDTLKVVSLNIELLYKETEERLGAHFKICDLFGQIADKNKEMCDKLDEANSLGPLKIFQDLIKLKKLKDNIFEYLKNCVRTII